MSLIPTEPTEPGKHHQVGPSSGAVKPAPVRRFRENTDNRYFPYAAFYPKNLRELLPPEMLEADCWVVWAYWWDRVRWKKEPRHYVKQGTSINIADSSNQTDYGTALSLFYKNRRYNSPSCPRSYLCNPRFCLDGIGWVFRDDLPYSGIDLDKCVDYRFDERSCLHSEIAPWAREILELFQDSYAELSPSLTGVKIFPRGKLEPGRSGAKFTGFGQDGSGAVEIYDSDRYFTVTGIKVKGHPSRLGERSRELNDLYSRLLRERGRDPVETPKANPSPRDIGAPDLGRAVPAPRNPDPQGSARRYLKDDVLLRLARTSRNRNLFHDLYDLGALSAYDNDASRADYALCCMLAFWTGKDEERMDRLFRSSALMQPTKWDQPRGGSTYGRQTIQKAIADTRSVFGDRL